jgi:hypothetical protein
MRVTSNTKLIQRRSKLGMIASLAGIGVLAVGMIASFRPQIAWVSLIALVLGFILAQFGSYNLRRWGRTPRPDQVIEESMKGFDDRYHFYAWSLPVPYVLLSPQGIYTFITRDQTGKVTAKGKTWQTKFSLSRLFMMFAQEGMGNPTDEAELQAKKLTDWIRGKLPEVSATVQPVIVFIDARAELDITDPVVPVLEPKSMKKWLRGGGKGDNVRPADLKALEALFDETATKDGKK